MTDKDGSSSTKPEDVSSSKGKGKAPAADDSEKEVKKDKDGNPFVDGKPGVDKEEELSEDDQKLKDELDMLVERLLESDSSLYKPALETIKSSIKTSTSSMTAVPKPLKFLRPHYESLEKAYESWPEGENKVSYILIERILLTITLVFSS
jgi:26S proteasome regulatory subunit N1